MRFPPKSGLDSSEQMARSQSRATSVYSNREETGDPLEGIWRDRPEEYRYRLRGKEPEPGQFATIETSRAHSKLPSAPS
jgi:hypothetical protein